MNAYKIYLGSPHEGTKACEIVQAYFDGFTVYRAKGYWQGKSEETTVFEIVTDSEMDIRSMAERLRYGFNQHCVMVVKQNVDVSFVEG